MRSRMRSKDTLCIRLKVEEIPPKRIHDEIHVCFRERRVEHQRGIQSYAGRDAVQSCKEGLEGVIPADVVRNGVGKPDVFETTGRDLEVIVRVTPESKTIVRRIGKDRCVIKVRGVYFRVRTETRHSMHEELHTLRPVPIRVNTIIPTFRSQFVFKSLDILPVPGKEESRHVNLQKVRCMGQWSG